MTIKIILLYCLLLPGVFAADESVFRFGRDIINPDDSQQSLLAVPLDTAVYAATNADFSDLRVRDSAGVETPYLLQKIAGRKTTVRRVTSHGEKPLLQTQGEDGIVINLELKPNAANIDGFSVVTTQRDFEYVLEVQGSEEGRNWHTLVDNALIYDYSRFMNVANHDVVLPVNSDRHFKVTIARAIETREAELMELTRTLQGDTELQRNEKTELQRQPLHIERIELWHNQTETVAHAEQLFDYPIAFTISQDAEHKTTQLDVQTQNQPLSGFTVNITTANFSRQAEVAIPQKQGMETRMQTLARASLQGLHFKDINKEDNRIGFAEQRRPHYRISIYNQDNPPLDIDNVTGFGPGYQVVFFAQPGQNYHLQYGASRAVVPRYDTAPIQTLLSKGYQTVAAGLGPEVAIVPQQAGFDAMQLLNSQLFLGLVIGLMVLVLGWSLFRVSQRL
ncbi:hypothetical protein [Methylomonas methanica]|uniref:DUF3999 domain-containing protein n=1 Tax=Methylomonas methanica (strain DSM 25384 / MC09) TaxID=857087 RepID=G0A650_METMM|nr:hypothetical protein [Methylomonas methanica]AEG00500.1 hypothetical protein Metme_2095 [Methylomonas methanica MC09]